MEIKLIKNKIAKFASKIYSYIKQHKIAFMLLCIFLGFIFFWYICSIDIAFKFLTICVTLFSVILGCASLIAQSIIKHRDKLIELQKLNYNVIKECYENIKQINECSYLKITDENFNENVNDIKNKISKIEFNIDQIEKYQNNIVAIQNEMDIFAQFSTSILKYINSLLK